VSIAARLERNTLRQIEDLMVREPESKLCLQFKSKFAPNWQVKLEGTRGEIYWVRFHRTRESHFAPCSQLVLLAAKLGNPEALAEIDNSLGGSLTNLQASLQKSLSVTSLIPIVHEHANPTWILSDGKAGFQIEPASYDLFAHRGVEQTGIRVVDKMKFHVMVCFASTPLTVAQLRCMRAGDALLLSIGQSSLPIVRLGLRHAARQIAGVLKERSIMLTDNLDYEEEVSGEDFFDEPDSHPDITEPGILLNEKVELVCSLPSQLMQISELGALVPGHCIELSASPEDCPITIRVGSRKIATGRLIMVGDRMAVQISQIDLVKP
jgi:flagellar motor switch/type III secretory pathway protein FliN